LVFYIESTPISYLHCAPTRDFPWKSSKRKNMALLRVIEVTGLKQVAFGRTIKQMHSNGSEENHNTDFMEVCEI
jgi:hypothetical protein